MRRATLFAVAVLAATVWGADDEAPAGKASRKFEFTYKATIKDVPPDAKSVELWIPVPQDGKHQKIANLKFDAPAQPDVAVEPTLNNKMAHWKLDAAKAKGLTVTMTFEVERQEIDGSDTSKARDLTDEEKKAYAQWLKADKLVLVGGDFAAVADAAIKDAKGPAAMGKAAYDYTVSTMKYDKPKDKQGWGKGSTQWACDAKFGNCTDFHAMIMSIGRTKGIPVKFEMGFPLPDPVAEKPETSAGPIGGYHCWAKYYVGGVAWIPVDASEAQRHAHKRDYFHGRLCPNRVHMTNGRDVNLVPKQAGEPLNFFIYPYAEADGKSITVDREFAFKDLK